MTKSYQLELIYRSTDVKRQDELESIIILPHWYTGDEWCIVSFKYASVINILV